LEEDEEQSVVVIPRGRPHRKLRKGDVVEVRPAAEILATLDDKGCLDGVPFMPEMLQHVGCRFAVDARVERACDTIGYSGARKMADAVLLGDLRCDGTGHDGCQAGCRLYWKEAWLRRVGEEPGERQSEQRESPLGDAHATLADLSRATATVTREGSPIYRCQATEFVRATTSMGWFDPRSFINEVTCGNVGIVQFLRVTTRLVLEESARRLRIFRDPVRPRGDGDAGSRPDQKPLNLKAGDLVQVRTQSEIESTLEASLKNRGLLFDREMVPYCGETRRVLARVDRFIDDRTGKMIELKSDCVILDGAYCRGYVSRGRWFCPRQIYSFWRESWLRPYDDRAQ
jgi:hypothetical protein